MVYFLIDTYLDPGTGRGSYDDYIRLVKPVVESYGGKYLIRSEKVSSLSEKRNPQRVILIQFPDREHLEQCFSSREYKGIMNKRVDSVDARAVIVEEEEI